MIGMRRTGKTWFLFRKVQEALAEGVPRERELRSGTVVTLHETETVRSGAARIRVVPAWRWLLEGLGG